jgi:Uma2 family endonuclease
MKSAEARRRFTVYEYYRMAEAGILNEDDRVELIDGDIIEMAPIGNRHTACVKRLNRLFSEQLGRSVVISVQDPIRLSSRSEPQPDLALLRPRDDFYAAGHPTPADVLLIVEVVDSSLPYDRRKLRLYARAGIPCVWLAIVSSRRVEVHREPTVGGYRSVTIVDRGTLPALPTLPDLSVSVEDIFGPEDE